MSNALGYHLATCCEMQPAAGRSARGLRAAAAAVADFSKAR